MPRTAPSTAKPKRAFAVPQGSHASMGTAHTIVLSCSVPPALSACGNAAKVRIDVIWVFKYILAETLQCHVDAVPIALAPKLPWSHQVL